jgi:hypothetical protein
MNSAEATNVAFYGDIVRRVSDHHRRSFLTHQGGVAILLERAGAKDAMPAQQEEIAWSAHRRSSRYVLKPVGRILPVFAIRLQTLDPQIDLAHLEPGGLQIEVELEF